MAKLKIFSLVLFVFYLNECFSTLASLDKEVKKDNVVSLSSSSINPLGEFSYWAEYHKQSGRLDSILGKCYECIRDRSLGEKDEYNYNSALNSFSFPPFNIPPLGLAFYLAGPIINSGGAFVSRGQREGRQSTSYGSTSYASSAGYTKNNYYNGYPLENKFSKSLSCIVGEFGVNAYVTACEYGNNYCKISINEGAIEGLCVPICVPNAFEICSTGALSNKLAPICLVGSLLSGSAGAIPTVCSFNQMCQFTVASGDSSCVSNCENVDGVTSCSAADFGAADVRGPLCYVGIFGQDGQNGGAELLGCGLGDFCKVETVAAVTTGSCATACTNTSTVKCYTTDFANKQGPVCFVGTFGDDAIPLACLYGQVCQRDTVITPFGTSLTKGFCASSCVPSATTYCCNGDLCNSYQNTLNDRICSAKKYEEGNYGSNYGSSYGSNAGYSATPAYKY